MEYFNSVLPTFNWIHFWKSHRKPHSIALSLILWMQEFEMFQTKQKFNIFLSDFTHLMLTNILGILVLNHKHETAICGYSLLNCHRCAHLWQSWDIYETRFYMC